MEIEVTGSSPVALPSGEYSSVAERVKHLTTFCRFAYVVFRKDGCTYGVEDYASGTNAQWDYINANDEVAGSSPVALPERKGIAQLAERENLLTTTCRSAYVALPRKGFSYGQKKEEEASVPPTILGALSRSASTLNKERQAWI